MPQPRCKWSSTMTVVVVLFGLLLLFQELCAQEVGLWSKDGQQFITGSSAVDRSSFQNPVANEKVKLDIYYETNCPDTMDFITKQLWPTFQEMSSIMKVNLFPFGKASKEIRFDGSIGISCHHGPSECFGNRIQACATKLYPNTTTHLSFINCMESYFTPSSVGSKCARRNSLDYSRILNCANGPDGAVYMNEMAAATGRLNPPLYFVPWIVVNDVFSEAVHKEALENLSSVVCMFYKGKKPSACLPYGN